MESEHQKVAAGNIRVGDIVHKQRGVWFTVATIERNGKYVCLHDAERKHWKNAGQDTLLLVKGREWKRIISANRAGPRLLTLTIVQSDGTQAETVVDMDNLPRGMTISEGK